MIHEPFLPFATGNWRQNAAAVVQRLMTAILLHAAERVWLSTPAWEKKLRPFELGAPRAFGWLPVPSNVPCIENPAAVSEIRRRYEGRLLLGHFGTFGHPISAMLDDIIPAVLRSAEGVTLLLIGSGSEGFLEHLIRKYPDIQDCVQATGRVQEPERLSAFLAACDLLIQPYPDGITTRRSTIMAVLSHGRPAVTTAGALTEPFWESSGAVALAPIGDTQAFVNLTLRMLQNTADRASFTQAAREFYRRRFDLPHIVALLRGAGA